MIQATAVLLYESMPSQIRDMMSGHRLEEQQNNLRGGIEQVAQELIRVTHVMGPATHQMGESASASDNIIVAELQQWSDGLEARVPQAMGQWES